MTWTAHGHWTGHGDPTTPAPPRFHCGGPHLCPDCALQAQRAAQEDQVAVTLGLEPEPTRLIKALRIVASRARQCRAELAAIPDDAAPLEVAMEALGIWERHADGCADELDALTAASQRADDDGMPPND